MDTVRRVEQIMGTAITVEIVELVDPRRASLLADQVFAWFREVDQRFSTYRPDSEVNRLDRGELAVQDCSADLRWVLEESTRLWEATNGYFDVYAAGHLDPSGYVKGWSVQVASDRLVDAGAGAHCINAGGDVRVRGTLANGDPWRIGIQHPWESDKVAWVVTGTDLAVATSGTYERGFHVLDPISGLPATFLRSVTVTGPDLGIADAYATAAVAMGGEQALDWLAGLAGYEAAAVTETGHAFRSAGLPVSDGPRRAP